MGIFIDYQGKLEDLSRIDELVEDVKEFCRQVQWEFVELNEQLVGIRQVGVEDWSPSKSKKKRPKRTPQTHPDDYVKVSLGSLTLWLDQVEPDFIQEKMRGVYCLPAGTESVNLIFDSSGNLCTYQELGGQMIAGRFKDVKYYSFAPPFTKTTGCIEEHIRICKLLKQIQSKYLPKLIVRDDTGYFETLDEAKLMKESLEMSALIGTFRSNPSLLKAALGLPEDSNVSDVTGEFNGGQRKAGVDSKAVKKTPAN